MGLDVYLSRYENYETAKRIEKLCEAEQEALWKSAGKYEDLSEEKKTEILEACEKIEKKHGVTDGRTKGEKKIERDSKKYPEHYFKIGYFRSSYNEGGIERVLSNLTGKSPLHYIFDPKDRYEFSPNWEECLKRVKEVRKQVDEKLTLGHFGCSEVHIRQLRDDTPLPNSPEKAMEIFRKELSEKTDGKRGFDSFSNIFGEFFLGEPMKVKGIVPGISRFGNDPCVYVLYESKLDWYVQALEIVEDTIKYVLRQEDPQKYYLRWSG